MLNIKKVVFLAILMFVISYLRENTFLVINAAIQETDTYKANMEIPSFLLENFSKGQLVKLKYVLTIFSMGLFTTLGYGIIRLAFSQRVLNRITLFIYGLLFVVSLLMFSLHQLSHMEAFYHFAVRTSHFMQSPVIILILLPLFYFYHNLSKRVENKEATLK